MIHIVSTGLFTAGDAAIASSMASVAVAGNTIDSNNRTWIDDLGGYNWASAAIDIEPVQWRREPWSDLSTLEIRREVSYEEFEAIEKRVAELEELVKNLWQAKSAGDLL